MKDTILLSRSFYSQSLYFYWLRLKLRDYYFLGIILAREIADDNIASGSKEQSSSFTSQQSASWSKLWE